MCFSRSVIMADLHAFLARSLRVEVEEIRFWVLGVNGIPQRTLIVDDTITLHKLGALTHIQVRNSLIKFFFYFTEPYRFLEPFSLCLFELAPFFLSYFLVTFISFLTLKGKI